MLIKPKKRSRRRIELVVPIVAIIIVVLLGILMTPLYILKDKCKTESCNNESSTILDNINPEVDPCQDFFGFACGRGDLKNTRDSHSLIGKTRKDVLKLYNEPMKGSDHKSVDAIKTLFQICAKERNISDEVKDVLGGVDGNGWPLIQGSEWDETEFNWVSTTYGLRKEGYPFRFLIDISIGDDPRNRQKSLLKIALPEVSWNNQTVADILEAIKVDISNATQELTNAERFANIIKEQKRKETGSHFPYKLTDLQKDIPSLDWEALIVNLVNSSFKIDSDKFEVLMEQEPMREWLDLVASADKRVQANYILLMLLQKLAPFLNLSGHSAKSRQDVCYDAIHPHFIPNPISIAYARKELPQHKRKRAQEMFDYLREAFLIRLGKSRKFSDGDKNKITKKLLSMTVILGEPQIYINNDTILDNLSADVTTKNQSLLGFYKELNIEYLNYMYGMIDKSKEEKWYLKRYMNPTLYDMYYDSRDNVLRIPTTQLQNLAFNDEKPKCLTFGKLGKKIAEQLSLLLTYSTSFYDIDGNTSSGWSSETKVSFLKSNECFVSDMQHFNFTTLSTLAQEYKSQVVAAKIAFDAYNKWVKSNGRETDLDLYYNQKQLFWISTAVCNTKKDLGSVYPNLNLTEYPKITSYAIARQNSEFKQYFKCPVGTPMTTTNKCQLI